MIECIVFAYSKVCEKFVNFERIFLCEPCKSLTHCMRKRVLSHSVY